MIGGLTSSAYASLSMTDSAICCIACLLHMNGPHLDGLFKSMTLFLSPTNLVERLFWVRHKMLSHFSIRSEATSNSSQSSSSAMSDQCRDLALPRDLPIVCRLSGQPSGTLSAGFAETTEDLQPASETAPQSFLPPQALFPVYGPKAE